jgi:hypothetical protein
LYEPIVSDELFAQVQRILKRRSHKGFVYQRENPDFPLRRFVYNPSGKKITGSWSQGRYKKYPYYRFIGYTNSQHKKETLEEAYRCFIDQYCLDPQFLVYFKTALKTALDTDTEKDFREAEKLRAYITELEERQTSLIEKNSKGVLSDSILRKQLDLIDEKLIKAHSELLTLPDKKEDIGELMDFATEYLLFPGNVWKEAPFKQRVELQWCEFPQGVTLVDGKFRTAQIASIFKAKDIFLASLSSKVHFRGQDYEPGMRNNSPQVEDIPKAVWNQFAKEIKRLAEILRHK